MINRNMFFVIVLIVATLGFWRGFNAGRQFERTGHHPCQEAKP